MKLISAAAIITLFAFLFSKVRGDRANVNIVSSGYCSKYMLEKKGVKPENYKPALIFDPKSIRIEPKNPKIPGCFRIIADNVTLTDPKSQLTAEFEMRLSNNADPDKPCLQCKKRQPKCGCGEQNSCMYCDFCKNIRKFVKGAKINDKAYNPSSAPSQCGCNLNPGSYTVDAEVCTPDGDELNRDVPSEVIDNVSEGKSFPLFTTIYVYDFRYNSLVYNGGEASAALKARKAKGLIACYIVGTNVSL